MSFHEAIRGALDTLETVAGIEIEYHRGQHWKKMPATPGRTSFDVTDSYDVLTTSQSRDFLIEAAGLILDGQRITPKRGDYIVETIRGNRTRFDVARPDGSEQVYRFADHARTKLRIHTTQAPGGA